MADTAFGPARAIPPAEVEDVDLYHAKSWVTKYIFSQDVKSHCDPICGDGNRDRPRGFGTVLVDAPSAGLPGSVRVYRSEPLPTVHHHARHDHGGLPSDCTFPGGLRKLPRPPHGGCPGYGLPLSEHAELLDLPARGSSPGGEFLRAGRAHGSRLDAVPTSGHPSQYSGIRVGHHTDARFSDHLHHRLHNGWAELRRDGAARAHTGHDSDALAADGVGHFHGHCHGPTRISRVVRGCRDDVVRPGTWNQLLHANDRLDGRTAKVRWGKSDYVPAPILVLRAP